MAEMRKHMSMGEKPMNEEIIGEQAMSMGGKATPSQVKSQNSLVVQSNVVDGTDTAKVGTTISASGSPSTATSSPVANLQEVCCRNVVELWCNRLQQGSISVDIFVGHLLHWNRGVSKY